ncbi:hypothetical protein KPH14_011655 [Odynerus spinipes]|uniref:Reverse transcriptase Ty1/copia-type domain-containing protein n=1 Tax=Odynerus spinipes TaxID=1348599 RepID=A0AAD9REH5_9HYME|nr:hypothetical protein KPH14_011655 [Odynerus spinipes]
MLDKETDKIVISRDVRFIENNIQNLDNGNVQEDFNTTKMKEDSKIKTTVKVKGNEITDSKIEYILGDKFEDEKEQDLDESIVEVFEDAEDEESGMELPESNETCVHPNIQNELNNQEAAKTWNEKLHQIITNLGFEQRQEIEETAKGLEKHFELTRLGELTNYLGINIERDSQGSYYIDQAQYIQKVINRFGLQDAKSSQIPLDTGYLKICRDGKGMKDNNNYQKLIGALLYVATHTRPDIAASVSILSQKIKQPTDIDWLKRKKTLNDLKWHNR